MAKNDDVYNQCPQFPEADLSINDHIETLSTDDSDSLPTNIERKALVQEAEQLRQLQANKEADLRRKYGGFVDSEPAFVFRNKSPYIPPTVVGIDRKVVEAGMNKLLYNEH